MSLLAENHTAAFILEFDSDVTVEGVSVIADYLGPVMGIIAAAMLLIETGGVITSAAFALYIYGLGPFAHRGGYRGKESYFCEKARFKHRASNLERDLGSVESCDI